MTEGNQEIQTTQKEKTLHNENKEQVPEQKKQQQSREEKLDDEDTERDHQTGKYRSGGRGKPPRRIIEEGINDPYCE